MSTARFSFHLQRSLHQLTGVLHSLQSFSPVYSWVFCSLECSLVSLLNIHPITIYIGWVLEVTALCVFLGVLHLIPPFAEGQFSVLVGVYFVCPDRPPKNQHLSYFQIIGTMAKYAVTEPILIQASLIIFASSAIYSCFWVTATFLLNGAPYHYDTCVLSFFLTLRRTRIC